MRTERDSARGDACVFAPRKSCLTASAEVRQAVGGARDRNAARRGRNIPSDIGLNARSISANRSGHVLAGASGSEEFDSWKPEKQIGQWSSSSASRDGCCVTACCVDWACATPTTSVRVNPEKARSCLWTCANDSASCSVSAASARIVGRRPAPTSFSPLPRSLPPSHVRSFEITAICRTRTNGRSAVVIAPQ